MKRLYCVLVLLCVAGCDKVAGVLGNRPVAHVKQPAVDPVAGFKEIVATVEAQKERPLRCIGEYRGKSYWSKVERHIEQVA